MSLIKINRAPTRPKSRLDDQNKEHLICFSDENQKATIQDAVNGLTKRKA